MRNAVPSSPWASVFVSGHFFTRWTWVITAPFAVTLLGGYDAGSNAGQRLDGFGIAIAVHILCGLLGLVAAWAERATRSRHVRIAVVGGAIVALGVVRPLVIDWLTRLAGLPTFPSPMAVRLVTNVVVIAVATTLVAILISSLRRRYETVSELGVVLGWLETERTHGRRLFAEAARVLAATERLLRAQLVALERIGEGSSARARAEALRSFALTVLRPSSRRLYDIRTGEELERSLTAESRRPPSGARHPFLLSAAPVGLPVGLYVVVLSPFVLARVPPATAIAGAAAAVVIGCFGEALTSWLASRAQGHPWSAAIVIGGGCATAVVIFAATTPIVGAAQATLTGPILTAPILYASLAVMCGAVVGQLAGLRQQEARLSERIRAYGADGQDGRRRADRLLLDAEQTMHGEAQSICLVAATRLDEHAEQAVWDGALRDLGSVLEALSLPRPVQQGTAETAVQAMLDGWSRVIDISCDADPGAWATADANREILQQLVDAMSEALTNILRHGGERRAAIAITVVDGRLQLIVESPGRITWMSGEGTGLRALRRRAESVELEDQGGAVRLTVRFGLPAVVES